MIRAFYSGKEGLAAQQTAMDDIANNIANVSSTGFKSKSAQFSDVLYSSMASPGSPDYSKLLAGNGVVLAADENDMSAGTPAETGSATDYMADGSGFFAVQAAGGNTFYTQDGSFSVTPGSGGEFLENAQGLFVLDASGNRITADKSGAPTANPGVFTFSNSQGLTDSGNSLFSQSATSGAPAVSNEGFRQGYLEGSNVDLAQQMSNMIMIERGFQMSSRTVQTADQIESMANDLKS